MSISENEQLGKSDQRIITAKTILAIVDLGYFLSDEKYVKTIKIRQWHYLLKAIQVMVRQNIIMKLKH